jgi:hypothetical protein
MLEKKNVTDGIYPGTGFSEAARSNVIGGPTAHFSTPEFSVLKRPGRKPPVGGANFDKLTSFGQTFHPPNAP